MYTFGPYPPRMTPKHRRCLHIITIERKSASRRDRSRNAWPGNLWPARSSSSVRTRVLPVCQPHSVLYVLGIPTHAINQQCHVAAIKVNPSGKEDVRKKTPDAPCNKLQIILDLIMFSFVVYKVRIALYIITFCSLGGRTAGENAYRIGFKIASPSVHCRGSTVRNPGRPRQGMAQHHQGMVQQHSNPPHRRLIPDFYHIVHTVS